MSAYLTAVAIGVLLSALWIYVSRLNPRWESAVFGYTLVLAGLIYVMFGLLESRDLGSMIPEALAGIGFITLAIMGLRGSVLALGIGWILHGIWDVAVPTILDVSYVPWFLEPTCLGFDFVVGTYLLLRARDVFPVRLTV